MYFLIVVITTDAKHMKQDVANQQDVRSVFVVHTYTHVGSTIAMTYKHKDGTICIDIVVTDRIRDRIETLYRCSEKMNFLCVVLDDTHGVIPDVYGAFSSITPSARFLSSAKITQIQR